MPVSDKNAVIMTTIRKEQKEKLQRVAMRHHRSMSKEIAYALELYLDDFDDEGGRKLSKQKEE